MFDFTPWQRWAIWALVLIAGILAVPNFFPEKTVATWPGWLPHKQLNLGLDLRGGSHILLEADAKDVAAQRLQTLEDTVRAELRSNDSSGRIETGEMSTQGGRLSFIVRNPAQLDDAVERMRAITRPTGLSGGRDVDVSVVDGTRILLTPTAAGTDAALDQAMNQAVEIIRRRIDELGTREPTIIRQGDNRIVVQVPGLQNPQELKALIGKTAKLEFKMVDTDIAPGDLQSGRAPPGSQILPYAETIGGGEPQLIAVKRRVLITGDQLIDAQPTYQEGQPVVSFRFDGAGSRRFARVTQENTGKPFAIILDNKVISAPRINEPILGGSGVISGNFTTESANQLAILLRSGKLPVELTVVEERTVGPDLGRDSIRAGTIASVVSVLAVAVFMLLTYGRFGIYANLALLINVIMILGVMTISGATLTLPGIAGLVLTIGAAVDANVLINERIREEQRKGRRIIDAVQTGYKEATRTIWDANIMNIIAGVIMFLLGTGPIKGFAVVLMIGIATSVFTAVTITRLLTAGWLRRRRPVALHI